MDEAGEEESIRLRVKRLDLRVLPSTYSGERVGGDGWVVM